MAQTEMQVMNNLANRRMYSFLPYRTVQNEEWSSPFVSALLSQLNIGFLVMDHSEAIVELNNIGCSLLGIEPRAAYGRKVWDLISCLDQQEKELDRLVQFLNTSYSPFEQLELSWKLNGSLERLVLRKGRQEETGFTFFIIENKTEQYRLTEQVRFHDRLATIGQVAAGTAHEIRNPLTSIKGFLQMIGDRMQEIGQLKEKSYIEIMLKEISRINHLVSEFLVLSRPREVNRQIVSVQAVLHEILPIIESEARLHNIDISADIPSLAVADLHGDGELLKQVFLNISKNAIEAMSGAGGKLWLSLKKADHFMHLVEIIDNGPGIPIHLQEKIFEPFFTTKEHGTGLGLPICQQIVREIGGKLRVQSSSEGCCFQLFFPVVT